MKWMRRETAVLACRRQEPGAGDASLPGPGLELPGAQGETCLLSSRLSGHTVLSSQRTSAPYSCLVTLGKSLPSSELVFISRKEMPHLGKEAVQQGRVWHSAEWVLESGGIISQAGRAC